MGKEDADSSVKLLPICHTSQNAQIHVSLNGRGEFLRASVVPKDKNRQTILPATEGSAGRAGSKLAPLSLGDKLQYVAGDYEEYGGKKKSGFELYLARLARWNASPQAVEEINAVFNYINKASLVSDLIKEKVLYYDESTSMLPSKWTGDKEEKPEIFKVLQGEQLDSLVRFSVEIPGKQPSELWKSRGVWQSWLDYYIENKVLEDNGDISNEKDKLPSDKRVFCFIDGVKSNFAGNHPAKIRNAGDGAKLISSNDTSGFTYLGRFLSGEQTCSIGYEVSQKAHNALRWLVARQGHREGSFALVAWAVTGVDIPDLFSNTADLFGSSIEMPETVSFSDTAQSTGNSLSKLIAGYSVKLGPTEKVIIMGLDSATPGRMAVVYSRNLTGSDFLKRVQSWHSECAWLQTYPKNKQFVGAPAPRDIICAAYGAKVDDKMIRAVLKRIIPCIVDGLKVPNDLVVSTRRRACNRVGHKQERKNGRIYEEEWEKTLGIACSIYKYNHRKREYSMALERDRTTRDYLYGRLLAVADCLEGFALKDAKESRPTNAARLMQRFADHPCSTWRSIELSLTPYRARLGGKTKKYDMAQQEIMDLFVSDEYVIDTSLTGEFLLGYHTQRSELMKSSKKAD
jgi:CRISPR-associated protein Csd1